MENIIQTDTLLAATPRTFKTLVDFIISDLLQPTVILIVSFALVAFLWGVSKYVLHAGDETKRTEGTQMMIYGIVALFVMVSMWGFVSILVETFFGGVSTPIAIPLIRL